MVEVEPLGFEPWDQHKGRLKPLTAALAVTQPKEKVQMETPCIPPACVGFDILEDDTGHV